MSNLEGELYNKFIKVLDKILDNPEGFDPPSHNHLKVIADFLIKNEIAPADIRDELGEKLGMIEGMPVKPRTAYDNDD